MRTTRRAMSPRLTRRANEGLPPRAYQTYQVLAPLKTHWRYAKCVEVDCAGSRPATCEEAECGLYANGWRTVLPTNSPLLDVARTSGRKFLEMPPANGTIEFVFPPGQKCFQEHQALGGPCQIADRHLVSLERQGIYVVRQGDARDRTGPRRQFTRPEDWADHFANHQDRIKTLRGR